MIYASDLPARGTKGLVIYKNKLHNVTVSSVGDISYHGSPCYVIHCKEITGESFFSMYDVSEEAEAKQKLVSFLQTEINTLKQQKKKIKKNIKAIRTEIETLTL